MKVYPICEPWWGDEGPGFERGFKEDFPANISKKVKDAFSNGNAHLRGNDPGGVIPTTQSTW